MFVNAVIFCLYLVDLKEHVAGIVKKDHCCLIMWGWELGYARTIEKRLLLILLQQHFETIEAHQSAFLFR